MSGQAKIDRWYFRHFAQDKNKQNGNVKWINPKET